MSTMTATDLPFRVVCDVRCLAEGTIRGFARYTVELLAALRDRDEIELVLATDVAMELPSRLAGLELRTVPTGREWQREQCGLPRLVEAAGADVLLSPANRGLPLFGGPSVLTLHDAVEWDPQFVSTPRGKDRVRFGYASVASNLGATRIITVSEHAANELHNRLGLGPSRVRVVTEAPGSSLLHAPDAAERLRVRVALDLPEQFVLYLGGVDLKKSVDTLVRAWARRDPRLVPPLVIAGKTSSGETKELLRLAEEAGGDMSRLLFVGYVPDELLRGLYAEADLFVFPAVAEGFGLPAVEAMAAGTPTVVADAGSLPEATRGAALRFPAKDEGALGLIMDRLFTDGRALASLGQIGQDAISVRTWDDVAADTETVLREAAATSVRSRVSRSASAFRHAHRWVR